jgi:hypothetical protein
VPHSHDRRAIVLHCRVIAMHRRSGADEHVPVSMLAMQVLTDGRGRCVPQRERQQHGDDGAAFSLGVSPVAVSRIFNSASVRTETTTPGLCSTSPDSRRGPTFPGRCTLAIIFGEKANGKSGELDHDELTDLLLRKSNKRAERKDCGACATHIENMSTTAGQGGITTQYAGKSVFHISSGKRGGNDGCSAFFTLSADSGPALVAGIVAVGWHAGRDEIYLLDWGKGAPFFTGNRLDITKQQQKGYKVEK